MQSFTLTIQQSLLFQGVSEDTISKYLNPSFCPVMTYNKGEQIVLEGATCSSLGIILEGVTAVQQYTTFGDALTINLFNCQDTFGIALFSMTEPTYPFSLVAMRDCRILYIPFEIVKNLLENDASFNKNFIQQLSLRVLNLKDKIQMLQHKDVRSRLIFYLNQNYMTTCHKTFQLKHSKTEISEIIGVARPSLSREIRKMVEESIISIKGNLITILEVDFFRT